MGLYPAGRWHCSSYCIIKQQHTNLQENQRKICQYHTRMNNHNPNPTHNVTELLSQATGESIPEHWHNKWQPTILDIFDWLGACTEGASVQYPLFKWHFLHNRCNIYQICFCSLPSTDISQKEILGKRTFLMGSDFGCRRTGGTWYLLVYNLWWIQTLGISKGCHFAAWWMK